MRFLLSVLVAVAVFAASTQAAATGWQHITEESLDRELAQVEAAAALETVPLELSTPPSLIELAPSPSASFLEAAATSRVMNGALAQRNYPHHRRHSRAFERLRASHHHRRSHGARAESIPVKGDMEAAPEAHERSLVESTSQSESQAQVEAEHFVASEKVLTENDYPAPEQQQRAAPRRLRAKDYPTPANEKVEAEVPQSTHSAGGLRDYPNPWAQPAQDSFLEQDANDFPAFVEMGTTIEGEAEGEADNELESLSTAISEAEGGITAATEAELEAQANAPTEEELRAQEESKQWSEAPLVDNLDTHKEAGEIANIHDEVFLERGASTKDLAAAFPDELVDHGHKFFRGTIDSGILQHAAEEVAHFQQVDKAFTKLPPAATHLDAFEEEYQHWAENHLTPEQREQDELAFIQSKSTMWVSPSYVDNINMHFPKELKMDGHTLFRGTLDNGVLQHAAEEVAHFQQVDKAFTKLPPAATHLDAFEEEYQHWAENHLTPEQREQDELAFIQSKNTVWVTPSYVENL